MRERIEAARSAWIEERVAAMQTREAERGPGPEIPSRDEMRAVARRAVKDGILAGPFPVEVEVAPGAFETRTVADLLAAPDRYDGRLTRDPLEPAYDGGRPVGRLFLVGGQPNLWSFAHGGHNFRLRRIAERIEVVTGRLVEATDATVDVLRAGTDIFVHAERMVLVQGGRILPFDEPALAHHIAGLVQFWRQPSGERGRAGPVEIDPPAALVKQVLSIGTGVGLKPLAGIVTAPTLRPDGSVLSLPGYDATTGLFLNANGQDLPMIEDHPERSSVELALATLMTPFTDFPLVGAKARGALLAGLLTAVVRPALPTAPVLAIDAPVQGSGKTLLASCIAALATGRQPEVWPHVAARDDEEVRKRLLAALRSGSGAIIWDNVIGALNSASLAAAITSPTLTDRVLGRSETVTVRNGAVIVLTGNNLTLAGDLPRRVLVTRIDPGVAIPSARMFCRDPLAEVLSRRLELVAAALTLIRDRISSDAARADGRTASFELWDDMVRQTVAWVGRDLAPGEFDDPLDLMRAAQGEDPDLQALCGLLRALRGEFGAAYFTARDVHARLCSSACDIGESLADLAGEPHPSSKSIGRILVFRRDRIALGLVLRVRQRHEGNVFSVEDASQSGV